MKQQGFAGLASQGLYCLWAAFALGCGAAVEKDGDGVGSETNFWLGPCDDDADCEAGACHCGVCTRTCDDGESCSDIRAAECIAPEQLGQCDAVPKRSICATEAALENANPGFTIEKREPDSLDAGPPSGPHDPDGGAGADSTPAPRDSGSDGTEVSRPSEVDGPVSEMAAGPDPVPPPAGASVADPSKVDLLLVVDNSRNMVDKQAFLASQILELTWQLVNPPCVAADGSIVDFDGDPRDDIPPDACPEGSVRSHVPVEDLHVGTITTSLGAHGSEFDCTGAAEGEADNAHLLGTLRDSPSDGGFYRYCSEARAASGACEAATDALAYPADIDVAGEQGCGYESSLESWYRFLVEPKPWTSVTRQNCPFGGDTNQLCVGPELDESGNARVDEALLDERAAFLRPDSVLIVVLVTDENDCSFRADGQSWRLAQAYRYDNDGNVVSSRAYRASTPCAANPNDTCCVSCGAATPAGCPTELNADGAMVSMGCRDPIYPAADDLAQAGSTEPTEDAVNLRCFQQKQRFGVDYLYPVERYSRALSSPELCPTSPDLNPTACAAEAVIPNPLFAGRSPADVIIAGLVGAPWQDLAVDPTGAASLVYRSASQSTAEGVDWSWLIGERNPSNGIVRSADPLMVESIAKRTGTQPSTGADLTEEWNILDRDDLQFACTFELPTPSDCPSIDDLAPGISASCDCTYYGYPDYEHPLCLAPEGTYGTTQYRSGAYPATRQLQVMYDLSEQAVVSSVCPKEVYDSAAPDYGYRPALNAIMKKLGERTP